MSRLALYLMQMKLKMGNGPEPASRMGKYLALSVKCRIISSIMISNLNILLYIQYFPVNSIFFLRIQMSVRVHVIGK